MKKTGSVIVYSHALVLGLKLRANALHKIEVRVKRIEFSADFFLLRRKLQQSFQESQFLFGLLALAIVELKELVPVEEEIGGEVRVIAEEEPHGSLDETEGLFQDAVVEWIVDELRCELENVKRGILFDVFGTPSAD